MIKLIYSYGLQPGSSLVLIAIIHVIFVFMDLSIGYAEKAVVKRNDWGLVTLGLTLFVWLVDLICLFCGAILKGSRQLLKLWLLIQIIIVVFSGVVLLIQWYHDFELGEHFSTIPYLVFSALSVIMLYGYEINLVSKILPVLSEESTEVELRQLEPTGKGCGHILEHYKNDTKSAAGLALITEIILNLRKFLERHLAIYIFTYLGIEDEITRSTVLTIEDTIVRYIRVGICLIGFDLTFKERKRWMFYWSFLYLASVLLSVGVFLYMIIMWRAVHLLVTFLYFARFTLELCYRSGVFLCCFRYADRLEPPQGFHE